MNVEIRNLKTFLKVAERKSFTKAAEALNYTQSTVSTQIKQLETELGVPLFERINQKTGLTERGKVLMKHGSFSVSTKGYCTSSSIDIFFLSASSKFLPATNRVSTLFFEITV